MKHQVLYIKKNLIHSAITTSKDIKIRQPGPEKRGGGAIVRKKIVAALVDILSGKMEKSLQMYSKDF